MFNQGLFEEDWLMNLMDFLSWCEKEMMKCRPTGFALQSMYITSGKAAFDRLYPNFIEAYAAYQKHVADLAEGES